jgi:hypothetical protein
MHFLALDTGERRADGHGPDPAGGRRELLRDHEHSATSSSARSTRPVSSGSTTPRSRGTRRFGGRSRECRRRSCTEPALVRGWQALSYLAGHDVVFIIGEDFRRGGVSSRCSVEEPGEHYLHVQPYLHEPYCTGCSSSSTARRWANRSIPRTPRRVPARCRSSARCSLRPAKHSLRRAPAGDRGSRAVVQPRVRRTCPSSGMRRC